MIMDRHGLDGFIAPSATGPAPRGLESTGDPVMCLPWTHAGVPAISLPWFPEPDALPLGLQVVGSHGGDHALLGLCREIQPLLAGP
jgi:Asp-tRNA(Asn)/Glu-tRNA(Gln) amidotransferase A subunit family amidase